MTTIRIFQKNGHYTGFEMDGHAGYADDNDIVCAAVSVLSINTVNSIELLAKDAVEASEGDGHLTCRFPEGLSREGELLMDAMVLGLRQISELYTDNEKSLVTLNMEEV
jgi:uncharacterized protein YsxB (DUF464 family)